MQWNIIKQRLHYWGFMLKVVARSLIRHQLLNRFFTTSWAYLARQLYWTGYAVFLLLVLCTLLFMLLLLIAGILSDPDKLYECGC